VHEIQELLQHEQQQFTIANSPSCEGALTDPSKHEASSRMNNDKTDCGLAIMSGGRSRDTVSDQTERANTGSLVRSL